MSASPSVPSAERRARLLAASALAAVGAAGLLGGVALDRVVLRPDSALAAATPGGDGEGGGGGATPAAGRDERADERRDDRRDGRWDGRRDGGSGREERMKRMRERFAQELGLTPAQRLAVDSLMRRQSVKMSALRETIRPRMDSLFAESRRELDAVLTPAQREKWGAMQARMSRERERYRDSTRGGAAHGEAARGDTGARR